MRELKEQIKEILKQRIRLKEQRIRLKGSYREAFLSPKSVEMLNDQILALLPQVDEEGLLTDEELARRCVACSQGYWWHGVHVCKRKKCKYWTSYTSIYFKDK